MKPLPIVAVALVAVLLIAAFAVGIGHGGTDTDRDAEPTPTPVPEPEGGYPEGISVDRETRTVSYSGEAVWHVHDLFEKNYVYDDSRSRWVEYVGYDITGPSIGLDPGYYRVTVDGLEFDIGFAGFMERTSGWDYDIDGRKFPVSISYTIDVGELIGVREESLAFNYELKPDGTDYVRHQFGELPGLVDVDDTVKSVEGSLRSEFERIGGSVSDRQGYADFLASFVQVAIPYPPSIYLDGKDRSEGWDFAPYGKDEYWARSLETLCIQMGDCEDTAILLCALYAAAGYQAAVGGHYGHVFAGVALEDFVETSKERLEYLDPVNGSIYGVAESVPVEGSCDPPLSETVFYAVETIKYDQIPVGYLKGGSNQLGTMTPWGMSGFYPYQGAESGIQGSS